MTPAAWLVPVTLCALVVALLAAERTSQGRAFFQRLPIPLWCYLLPMALRTVGWLPAPQAAGWVTSYLFPVSLVLLLIGIDLRGIRHVGRPVLIAMAAGTLGILVSGPVVVRLLAGWLPEDAWKGAGALAATWTGGSLNLLAMRTVLDIPDATFAPLLVVDALVAYGWMACLMACRNMAPRLDRWLGATPLIFSAAPNTLSPSSAPLPWRAAALGLVTALGLTLICRAIASQLPVGSLVSSATGWTVLLVTTICVAMTLIAPQPAQKNVGLAGARRLVEPAGRFGYPGLYLVLAFMGAQTSLTALAATPAWILVGFLWLLGHGAILVIAGRLFRLPTALLATASQANVGGVVSAPIVGAVYHPSLAPVGLVLAMACNAVGTYLGLLAGTLARWLGA